MIICRWSGRRAPATLPSPGRSLTSPERNAIIGFESRLSLRVRALAFDKVPRVSLTPQLVVIDREFAGDKIKCYAINIYICVCMKKNR